MRKNLLVALVALTLGASQALAQNALKNPGFEDPTVIAPESPIGKWFRFQSEMGVSAESTTDPLSGARHMSLSVVGANQFAGVFQRLESTTPGVARGIGPGATVTFSGFHRSATQLPSNATSEIKIEWTGAPQNRFDVLAVPLTYTPFVHAAVAPAGTTGATITYAISSFGVGQGDSTVFIDDFTVTVVPEPATAGLLGFGALGLVRLARRRRK